jgi:hypothetical protein
MFAILLLLIPSYLGIFAFYSNPGSHLLSNSNAQYSNFFDYISSISSYQSPPMSSIKSKQLSHASSTPYLTLFHTSLSNIKSTPWKYIPSTSLNPHTMFDSSTPYLTLVHTSLSTIKSTPWKYISSSSHCFNPYLNPSQCPSVNPSQCPSVNPSKPTIISILSFETAVSLSGLTEPVLDDPAQTAVTVAVANSANVSAQFVIFVKQHPIITAQKYLFELNSPTYAIEATTQLNVPLSGANPNTLYSSLSNSIVVAVGNGDFNAFLVAASIAVNSTSTQNAISTDVVVTPMVILSPSPMPSRRPSLAPRIKPSRRPSANPSPMPSKIPFQSSHSQEKSEEVVLFIMIGFIVLCIIVYFYVKRRDQKHIILDIQDI